MQVGAFLGGGAAPARKEQDGTPASCDGGCRLAHPKRFTADAAERADVPIAFEVHGKGGGLRDRR